MLLCALLVVLVFVLLSVLMFVLLVVGACAVLADVI